MINKITLTMLLCVVFLTTQTKAQQKLVAFTHAIYHTSGTITEDSTRYYHSGTKANSPGKYKIPEFTYMADSFYVYKYDNTSKTMVPNTRTIFTYTGTDFKESITDSFKNNAWSKKIRTRAIYVSGKPDTIYYDSWSTQGGGSWGVRSRIIYTWNGNNVASRERHTYDWNNTTKKFQWNNRSMWTYTYSGNEETEFIEQNWSSGSYQNVSKRTTTIAAGKPSEMHKYTWTSGAWKDQTWNKYTRDGSSRLLLDYQQIYGGSAWEDNQKDTSIYIAGNTTQFRDTLVSLAFTFGNYINKGKWSFKYLPDGRMTEQFSLSWDGVSVWKQTDNVDSIEKWYYDWNVSVENVATNNTKLNVYPSPASNTINITLDGMATNKQIDFAIVDMQGRLMKNWAVMATNVTTMSIDELAAGNYILYVTDGTQKATKQFVVNK